MTIEIVLVPLTLAALIIASISDLKTREVPDWLNYGLIFAALGIRTIFSFSYGWEIIVSGLLGLAACFILANIFYYSKQWGGGDSKLLMGIGTSIGISLPFSGSSLNLALFLLGLLFLGAIYGLFWMFYLAAKRKNFFFKEIKGTLKEYKILHLMVMTVSVVFLIISFFFHFFWPLVLLPASLFYLLIFVNTMEDNFFTRSLSPEKLTEGDWLVEEVKVAGKNIMKKKTLCEDDIKLLKKIHEENKLKYVKIKEGIPFVPSFLLSYLFLTFGMGLVWKIVRG